MRAVTAARLSWIAATDSTWQKVTVAGQDAISGKCIHCNRRLTLTPSGEPISRATIEHIVPRTHGGTDALDNLAIACARCNAGKGHRHDHKAWTDPKLQAVIETLTKRRAERWREPPEGWDLPRRPEPRDPV